MPNYKGHLLGGAAAYGLGLWLLISSLARVPTATAGIEWLFFALAGSLFPDIDTKSKGQKYFYRIVLCLQLFLIFSQKITLLMIISIISLLPLLVNHRGIFHRTWFVIGAPTVIALCLCSCFPRDMFLIVYDLFFFILGALSHLWLDLGLRRMIRW